MSVLIYIENTNGKFKKSVFEAVSYARETADLLSTDLSAISIGSVEPEELAKIGTYGAMKVLTVDDSRFNSFSNRAYASIIAGAAKKESANIIILSNSFSGKDLAPRIAAKIEAALVEGAIALPKIQGNSFSVRKGVFSGKAFAEVELINENKVIALNPNSFEVKEFGENAQIEKFSPETGDKDLGILIKEIIRATDKVSLADAEIVVSAGRGLKAPENWKMIEELATVLGAATACSKPVSDAGWRPHEEHVGQTGLSISPNLYIAIGISGAIQHLAGITSSKIIVVINKDPEAPFFKVADYGIVGDAFEIVPKLIEKIKEFKSN